MKFADIKRPLNAELACNNSTALTFLTLHQSNSSFLSLSYLVLAGRCFLQNPLQPPQHLVRPVWSLLFELHPLPLPLAIVRAQCQTFCCSWIQLRAVQCSLPLSPASSWASRSVYVAELISAYFLAAILQALELQWLDSFGSCMLGSSRP